MSDAGRAYVWKHSPYTGAKFTIHLALGDLANDTHDNELWVRHQYFAAKTRLQRETVTRALLQMCEEGFLERLTEEGNPGKVVRYRFLMPDRPVIWDHSLAVARPVTRDHRTSDERSPLPVISDHTRTKEEPKEPKLNISEFDQFWEIYPRRVGKRTARTAFTRALNRATHEEILLGAKRLASEQRELRFTPHPATWLNRDGWLDETTESDLDRWVNEED